MHIVRKHFDTLDSTNTWAKQNGEILDPLALTVVTAWEQTGGRGRFSRKWHSPPGLNIYATYAFFLNRLREDLGNIPQLLALSAAQILNEYPLNLKWPNDLQIGDKKLGGILCETTWVEKKLLVAVGIGLNLNMPLELLQEIDRPATSLMVESGQEQDVEEWLERLNRAFQSNLETFLEKGFKPFFEEYKAGLVHRVGDKVRFHDNQKVWEGEYVGLTEDAALRLRVDGQEKVFIAGEFVL